MEAHSTYMNGKTTDELQSNSGIIETDPTGKKE